MSVYDYMQQKLRLGFKKIQKQCRFSIDCSYVGSLTLIFVFCYDEIDNEVHLGPLISKYLDFLLVLIN